MQFNIFLFFQEGLFNGPGDPSQYTNYTLQILGMLLVSFILGYLLRFIIGRKWKVMANELQTEVNGLKKHNTDLEAQLSTAKYELDKLKGEYKTAQGKLSDAYLQIKVCEEKLNAATEGNPNLVAGAGAGSSESSPHSQLDFARAFNNEQLQIIEGIGPKVETTLKSAGVNTWADVAAKTPDELKNILVENNPNFRIQNTTNWPLQASLANQGKWDELVELQKDLGATQPGDVTDSKAEKMAAKLLGITLHKPDDLKVVEGIGPKIETLLKDGGIKNWAELAAASTNQIQQILDKAGDNYRLAKPDTWPQQAQLAADGKWQELHALQDRLIGGK